jgi:hypothetical protein
VTGRIAVYLEVTPRRTFAGALEWPGWCRAGKTPEDALQALFDYAERYGHAIGLAKLGFTTPPSLEDLEVVERLKGNATTEFGAPGVPPKADDRPLDAKELKRQTAILEASWRAFDRAAERAGGVALTKGPRGGGRDVPKMTEHVAGAEQAYLSGLGSRAPAKAAALRQTVLDALAARAQGKPVADPNKVQKRWTPRFYLRRSAWHALDHAWEIEDRSANPQRSRG